MGKCVTILENIDGITWMFLKILRKCFIVHSTTLKSFAYSKSGYRTLHFRYILPPLPQYTHSTHE